MSNDETPKGDKTPKPIRMDEEEVRMWTEILNFYFPPKSGKSHGIDASGYPDKLVFTPSDKNQLFQIRSELDKQSFEVKINSDNGTIEMDTSSGIYPSMMVGLYRHVEVQTNTRDIMDRITGGKKQHPRINRDPDEGKGGGGPGV